MVYHKLPDKIANPGPLLGVMRTRRQAMTEAQARRRLSARSMRLPVRRLPEAGELQRL
jgi:hypothetical protein